MSPKQSLIIPLLIVSLSVGCVSLFKYDTLKSKYNESQRQSAVIRALLADANQIVVKSRTTSTNAVPVTLYLCQGYILLWNSS